MAPKFLLALTLLLATAMVVRADDTCTAEGCASCAAGSNTECAVCEEGFYLDDKTCKRCTQTGCTACTNASTCTSCTDGAPAVDGGCTACKDRNCKTCSNRLTCDTCNDGYKLEKGVCQRDGNSASTVAPVAIASTVLAASLIAVAA